MPFLLLWHPRVVGGTPPTPTPDVVKTGGKGDNKRRRLIVKPTGLLDRKATPTIKERLEDSAELHAEALEKYSEPQELPPIETMSQAEIDFEIGVLLRKAIKTEEDEILLLMLMMA